MIRYGYSNPLCIPENVYCRYLQERWRYYGVDLLSYAFSTHFIPDIVDETTKSNLLDFIREELAQFIDGEDISIGTFGSYCIESKPVDRLRLRWLGGQSAYPHLLLERLLEITLVRGIKEALTTFDKNCCPDGTFSLFQDVALLGGIKIEKEIKVFEGVRLVPLPFSRISEEVISYLPSFPHYPFVDLRRDFISKTLLVIDRPGFSRLHESPPNPNFSPEFPIDELPSHIDVHNVEFRNSAAVHSFQDLFCQALSLVCNSLVQIVNGRWFLDEDKSFNPSDRTINPLRHLNAFESSALTGEGDIGKAIFLYNILHNNSDIREKLRIPIDRWRKSKAPGNNIDKIIDLGIAFEALYVPDSDRGEIGFKLGVRAAWHLGQNKKHRNRLKKEFDEMYDWRSKVVHTGKLPKKRKKTPEEVSTFINSTQHLCRDSIMKVLLDEQFPDWNNLILAGEAES